MTILELCGDQSLEQRLNGIVKQGGEASAISEPSVTKILHDLVSGLNACHEKGIVHMDVKPENCLIAADMTLKLADFDISMKIAEDEDGIECKAPVRGANEWRTPENKGGILAKGIDIYSLGGLMYHVCTIVQRANQAKPYYQ